LGERYSSSKSESHCGGRGEEELVIVAFDAAAFDAAAAAAAETESETAEALISGTMKCSSSCALPSRAPLRPGHKGKVGRNAEGANVVVEGAVPESPAASSFSFSSFSLSAATVVGKPASNVCVRTIDVVAGSNGEPQRRWKQRTR
jgi:hypothetical protein